MSKLTAVTAAILVVLVGYGIAEAATVTLTIDIASTTLAVGETTAYTVYGVVTDNLTDDTFGISLNGGIASYMCDQAYSGAGTIKHGRAASPPTIYNAATTSQAPYTALSAPGSLIPAALPDPGSAGVDNTFGAAPLPSNKFVYYTSGTAEFEHGNGTAVPLFTGSYECVALGEVTIDVTPEAGQLLVYQLDVNGLKQVVPEVIIPAQAKINASAAGNPPSVTIDTLDITEGDWNNPGGWNNPAASVTIDATGSDNDGGTQGLTWSWKVEGVEVSTAADQLVLSIQDLINAGLTPPAAPDGATWGLEVTVTDPDGSASDTMSIFVPEPTTMGLLGFGVLALLRRRRA